jgi:hypothetical protein
MVMVVVRVGVVVRLVVGVLGMVLLGGVRVRGRVEWGFMGRGRGVVRLLLGCL